LEVQFDAVFRKTEINGPSKTLRPKIRINNSKNTISKNKLNFTKKSTYLKKQNNKDDISPKTEKKQTNTKKVR